MCCKVFPCFLAISAWIFSVDSDGDEVMKQGDEALNVSLLQFLRIFKCFTATIFFSALNASSLLLFMENHHLTLHIRYF
jgi:hypothetical protein